MPALVRRIVAGDSYFATTPEGRVVRISIVMAGDPRKGRQRLSLEIEADQDTWIDTAKGSRAEPKPEDERRAS